MTNKAQYKLQLLLGDTGNTPLAGVAYTVIANGKVLSQGKTTATGETLIFEVIGLTSIKLQVFNPKMRQGKGGYLTPTLYDKDASSILLNNEVLDAINQLQTTTIGFGDVINKKPQRSPIPLMTQPKAQVVVLRLRPYIIVELLDHLKRASNTS